MIFYLEKQIKQEQRTLSEMEPGIRVWSGVGVGV